MATPRSHAAAEALAMLGEGARRQPSPDGPGHRPRSYAGAVRGITKPQNTRAHKGSNSGLLHDERQADGVNGRRHNQEMAARLRIKNNDGHKRRGHLPASGRAQQPSAQKSQRQQAQDARKATMQPKKREDGSAGSARSTGSQKGGQTGDQQSTAAATPSSDPAAKRQIDQIFSESRSNSARSNKTQTRSSPAKSSLLEEDRKARGKTQRDSTLTGHCFGIPAGPASGLAPLPCPQHTYQGADRPGHWPCPNTPTKVQRYGASERSALKTLHDAERANGRRPPEHGTESRPHVTKKVRAHEHRAMHGNGAQSEAARRQNLCIRTAQLGGAKSGNTWFTSLCRMAHEGTDIVCAQELGFRRGDVADAVETADRAGFDCVISPVPANRAYGGTAVLLSHAAVKRGFTIVNPKIGLSGGACRVDLQHPDRDTMNVCSVYAPAGTVSSTHPRDVFFTQLASWVNKKTILAGDFNCVLDTDLDLKRDGKSPYENKGASQLRKLVEANGLRDDIREGLGLGFDHTNRTATSAGICLSRIDRIYTFCVPDAQWTVDIRHDMTVGRGTSKHSPVEATLGFIDQPDRPKGKPMIKIDRHLLKNPKHYSSTRRLSRSSRNGPRS